MLKDSEIPNAGNNRDAATGAYNAYKVPETIDEKEVVSQIKSANQLSKTPLTTVDMLYSMSRTKSGRIMMRAYRAASDIFITTGGKILYM